MLINSTFCPLYPFQCNYGIVWCMAVNGIHNDIAATFIYWTLYISHSSIQVRNDTIYSIWRAKYYAEEMEKKTAAGYKVILSACWYLNFHRDEEDWTKVHLTIMTPLYQLSCSNQYYSCDPQNFNGTVEQKELVMGGGAALWAEYVDGTNLLSRLW